MADQLFLRCKVYPGQFSGEFAVSGEQVGGEKFSLFAPSRFVRTEQEPTRDCAVDGWLQVELWEQKGNSVVVRLPSESFESGRYVTVGIEQFRTRPVPAGANP
jgi:hypothetical protein